MNMPFEKVLGWIALVAGALWLMMGLWEVFGPSKEGNFFINIMVPIFAMVSAYGLLIYKKSDKS